MNKRVWSAALLLLALTGCGQPNVSGSYMARDEHGAALLQLTENQGHQVLGNMTLFRLLPDGQTERTEISITGGTVDARGHTLALTMKPNELFAQANTISGEISNRGIDLTMPSGSMHLSSTKPKDFEAVILNLAETGRQQQKIQEQTEQQRKRLREQAKQIAVEVSRIADLTRTLAKYNKWVQNIKQGPEVARMAEEHLVEAARKDLAIVHAFESRHQDYAAGQGKYRIGQLAYQMGQIKYQIDQEIQQAREHLNSFDSELAKSPCNINASLQGCDALAQEKSLYTTTRATVESRLIQLSSDLEKNGVAIEAINKQAGNQ